MIVLGIFILLATGLLAFRHLSETRSGLLSTVRPEELREILVKANDATALIEQIREEDSGLRKTYWGNRRAYAWAGYMLLIAIVGSRRATTYGRTVAEKLSRELVMKGVGIASGMARGIDSAAHNGALKG